MKNLNLVRYILGTALTEIRPSAYIRRYVNHVLFGLSICLASIPSFATLTTFEFQGQVTNVYNGQAHPVAPLSVGDFFSFSLTFDPNGTEAHITGDPGYGLNTRTVTAELINVAYISDAILNIDRSIFGDPNVTLPGPPYQPHQTYSYIYSDGRDWSFFQNMIGNYGEGLTLSNFDNFGFGRIGAGFSYLKPDGVYGGYAVYGYGLAAYDFVTVSVTPDPTGLIPSPPTQGNEIPEPTSLALVGIALAGLGVKRRQKFD